jgi:hypothetical protein
MAYAWGAEPSKRPYAGFDLTDTQARRLHRHLMCGHGFYEWLATEDPLADSRSAVSDGEDSDNSQTLVRAMAATSIAHVPRDKLPTVNYFEIDDQRYVDALLAEALPQDRERFRRYMSDRPLGLGIVTGVSQNNIFPDRDDH